MSKQVSEIFFTSNYVSEDSWLKFILAIGKLNGYFKEFKISVKIEKNNVRYFLETKKTLPTIISDLPEFLIKKSDENIKRKLCKNIYCVTNKERNIIDVYDKNETKFNRVLKETIISFMPYCKNNYLSKTYLVFEKENKKQICKKAIFNIPHLFLSIDFSKHTRFLYRKDVGRYLDIQKTIHLFESDNKNSSLKIDTFPYLEENYFLNLNKFDFDKHSLVVGGSGTGKSKLISSFICNLHKNSNYRMKYKVIVIDPHSDMENDIGGLEGTEIFNFKTVEESLNLFLNSNIDISTATELTLSLFKNLLQDIYNSKLERVLRHCIILLLINKKMSFNNLRKLILEIEYRNTCIRNEKVPINVKEFFSLDFNELKTSSYQEAISPIISFIDEIQTLPAFKNDGKIKRNLDEAIRKNFLSIISLNQAVLGERTTKTISSLLMSQILQLIQKYSFSEHIILIIDEVAVIENPLIKRFLSEARKYNLSVILAQQYFNQVSEELQKAIFSNVNNYFVFRVSREDAIVLSGNLQMEVAVHNSYFAKTRMLMELANRECILRISSNGRVLPAFKAKTLDFVSIPPKRQEKILGPIETKPRIRLPKRKDFNINPSISIKDLMASQSTGRKKVTNG